jgi:hypothetical protein
MSFTKQNTGPDNIVAAILMGISALFIVLGIWSLLKALEIV